MNLFPLDFPIFVLFYVGFAILLIILFWKRIKKIKLMKKGFETGNSAEIKNKEKSLEKYSPKPITAIELLKSKEFYHKNYSYSNLNSDTNSTFEIGNDAVSVAKCSSKFLIGGTEISGFSVAKTGFGEIKTILQSHKLKIMLDEKLIAIADYNSQIVNDDSEKPILKWSSEMAVNVFVTVKKSSTDFYSTNGKLVSRVFWREEYLADLFDSENELDALVIFAMIITESGLNFSDFHFLNQHISIGPH